MDNKYYIPSIEEFHVGFEYEELASGDRFTSSAHGKWVPLIQDENDFLAVYESYSILPELIKDEKLRVKYLDQEDIESLGWNYEKLSAGTESYYFTKDEYWMDIDFNFNGKIWLRIYESQGTVESELNYFSGFLNNKSELRKLLTQLGIEVDNK